MRSKTTKLRHERSNPNPNSRVVDFSECRHKTYHHVQNHELILNIFLKNWCGRRRPSYDMNDPTLTLTVGLWTFQNVDTKHTINVRNFELILNIFLKNWCGRRRPSYDMNDPTLTLIVGLWIFHNVDTNHTIMCRIFELILNILVKNWCGRRRPSYDMNDPTLTLTVGLWTFQNVDIKYTIMCRIMSWFWIYLWKLDAVEDDQVTTWTIQS